MQINKVLNKPLFNPTLGGVLLLGFSSGLPLSLTSTTLQAWYTQANINMESIAMLSLLGLPYSLKFIWAPLLDNYSIIRGTRRKGWILITQILLITMIGVFAYCSPHLMPRGTALIALLVVILSATQDVAIDGWRTEVLKPNERGLGAAFANMGYRLGMLISGGIALIMADHLGWHWTYLLMSLLMVVNFIVTLFIPDTERELLPQKNRYELILTPFKEFFSREQALLWIFFVILYKICDAFATSLTPVFLLRELGFTLSQVGMATKFIGIFGILAGVFAGGILLLRMPLFKALMLFGILQALSTLLFMWLATTGANFFIMCLCMFSENFCVGLINAAFIALIMALCDIRYAATQFAFFSALAVLARSLVGPVAGFLVERWGWANYFGWTCLIALPGLFLLWYLRKKVDLIHVRKLEKETLAYQS